LRKYADARMSYHAIAIARDANTVAAATLAGHVEVWDVASGKLRQFIDVGIPPRSIALSRDGQTMAYIALDGDIRLWDLIQAKELDRRLACRYPVARACFGPDSKTIALAAESSLYRQTVSERAPQAELWNIATGNSIGVFGKLQAGLTGLAFDGQKLAVCGPFEGVRVWDVGTGKEIFAARSNLRATCIALSADGQRVVCGTLDGVLHCWDSTTGEELTPLDGHTATVNSVAFAPNGKMLASAASDQTARLWDLRDGHEVRRLAGDLGRLSRVGVRSRVSALAYSQDRPELVEAGAPFRIWDPLSGKEVGRHGQLDLDVELKSAVISVDGKTAAGLFLDRRIEIWGRSRKLHSWSVEDRWSNDCLAISSDGRLLALGTDRGVPGKASAAIEIWDTQTCRKTDEWRTGQDNVFALAFTADNKQLASSGNRDIQLWQLPGRRVLRRLPVAGSRDTCALAFSCDARILAVAAPDHSIRVFEVLTGGERRCYRGHRGAVKSLCLDSGCRYLASGSKDSTVLVWDLARTLPGGTESIRTFDHTKESSWQELGEARADSAYSAVWTLFDYGDEGVAYLRGRLQPVRSASEREVGALIADLNVDDYHLRDKAARDLEALQEVAESSLRRAALSGLSPEAGRLADDLLMKLEHGATHLRALRAVEALERIATPNARRLLGDLSHGAPQTRLTQEAQISLERLATSPRPR
jgi:WD40 repeat protein